MVAIIMSLVLASTPPADAPRESDAPLEGIWPTSKMVDNLLSRWADDTSVKYDLDGEQSEQLRTAMIKRWSGFIKENRKTLQPLINEYLESQFAMEQPDTEAVSNWAKRALGIFDAFEQQLIDTHGDMQEIMTPKQQMKLAKESFKMTAGLELFRAKLESWERGQIEKRDWWQPTTSARREQRERRKREREEAERIKKAKTPLDTQLDQWEAFVADFAKEYQFDDAQRAAADSILRECKQRAGDHRARHKSRFEAIELSTTEDSASAEKAAKKKELYEPINSLFAELKSRVGRLRTTAQLAMQTDPSATGQEPPPDAE
jgi:hypothetical protein